MGALHWMILTLSIFWYGRELDHFTMVRIKYNYMYNIVRLVDMASKSGGGWKLERSKIKLVFYVIPFGNILITVWTPNL